MTGAFPPRCLVLDVHVTEPMQLFNAMDPAPFRDRDLDPKADEYVYDWASEVRRDAELGLRVRIDRALDRPEDAAVLRDAIHSFFQRRASSARWRLRRLLRAGRVSLVIGLLFLAGAIAAGDLLASFVSERYADVVRESFVIGGWVALWRPLEIFLYDWWPIRAEAQLCDRLGQMIVHVESGEIARG